MISVIRFESAWEMLKRLATRDVLGPMTYLAQTSRKFQSDLDAMRVSPGSYMDLLGNGQMNQILLCCKELKEAAREYGIVGVGPAINEVEYFFNEPLDFGRLDISHFNHLQSVVFAVHNTAAFVLGDMSIYVLTRASADFVSGDRVGFGEFVEEAFPSAVYDMHEASKCRGLERWTATVMHCCRALEPALHALETEVKTEIPKHQWGQRIDQIEAAIKRMSKATNTEEEVQWFSEAATQFHFMKSAWRNYAQHLKHTYDEDRATEIYDAVRTFMRHLATRLNE